MRFLSSIVATPHRARIYKHIEFGEVRKARSLFSLFCAIDFRHPVQNYSNEMCDSRHCVYLFLYSSTLIFIFVLFFLFLWCLLGFLRTTTKKSGSRGPSKQIILMYTTPLGLPRRRLRIAGTKRALFEFQIRL